MFYDQKRKEILTSTEEASKKQEGDRHDRGKRLDASRVHRDVSALLSFAYYTKLF